MSIHVTEEEFKAMTGRGVYEAWEPGPPRRGTFEARKSKYGNVRVEIMGQKFDSKHEAEVWLKLEDRKKRGVYKCVLRQVSFPLGGGTYKYRCDFLVIDKHDVVTVIDAKSDFTRRNRVYINKKKQMMADYGLAIVEM